MKKLLGGVCLMVLLVSCGRMPQTVPARQLYGYEGHKGYVHNHPKVFLQQQCGGLYTIDPVSGGTVYNVYCGVYNPGVVVDWSGWNYGYHYHYGGVHYHFWY